jgi:hypothetical protein
LISEDVSVFGAPFAGGSAVDPIPMEFEHYRYLCVVTVSSHVTSDP